MSKTTNYQLTVWDYGDEDFSPGKIREDLKANFTRLDAALKAEEKARSSGLARKTEIITGTYVGDNTEIRTISLGFTPQSVLILPMNSKTYYSSSMYGGMSMPDCPAEINSVSIGITIVTGGFQVSYRGSTNNGLYLNHKEMRYHYWAIC